MPRCINLRDSFASLLGARVPIRPFLRCFILFRKTLVWVLPFDVRNSPQSVPHAILLLAVGSSVSISLLHKPRLPGCNSCARARGLSKDGTTLKNGAHKARRRRRRAPCIDVDISQARDQGSMGRSALILPPCNTKSKSITPRQRSRMTGGSSVALSY
ncbi:hypothetical protein BD310DRAFT_424785 [Dichomitus squalens]|uniref:Uncharacterized protein n=1 Tax=Dichomitus squalens TaxID=114155 RepID=A0A4Q9PY27_9APHY|nr:hypothetical protein BD310DRAFT_424785 [Dichomitus squalens]